MIINFTLLQIILTRKFTKLFFKWNLFLPQNDESITLIDCSLIGDILLNLPYIHQYLEHYTQKKISLLCLDKTYPLLVALLQNKYPHLRIIPHNLEQLNRNIFYAFSLIFKIGRQSKVIIIHPYINDNMYHLAQCIPSRIKIAYESEVTFPQPNSQVFDIHIHNPYTEAMIPLQLHFSTIAAYLLGTNYMPSLQTYQKYLHVLKDSQNTLLFNSYIVIVTDSSEAYRSYPQHLWEELIQTTSLKSKTIILLGLKRLDFIAENVINLTAKTSLVEACQIILSADLVIGNETGLIHLSYLSGVSTLCLLGGGHYGRCLPPYLPCENLINAIYPMNCFGCNWECDKISTKNECVPCISSISNEILQKGILQLFQKDTNK